MKAEHRGKKQDFSKILKSAGLKNTPRRQLVMNTLASSEVPKTVEDIYFSVKEGENDINLSTVYRILKTFVDKGLAAKQEIGPEGRTVYEYAREMHRHYLVCLGCNKMITLRDCPLSDYEKELEKTTDYSIVGHDLSMYGYCPECKNKINRPQNDNRE